MIEAESGFDWAESCVFGRAHGALIEIEGDRAALDARFIVADVVGAAMP